MRGWQLALTLDPTAPAPIFLQISRALAEEVRRGRLRPGDPLPGSRALAESLQINRNTVLAAYHELQAEGWITTARAKGTFVSTALPDVPARRFAPQAAPRAEVPGRLGYELGADPTAGFLREATTPDSAPRGTLWLAGGVPDIRLLPLSALARAYRRAVKLHGRTVLEYGDARGQPRLRAALAQMLSAVRGLAASPETVLVTRGSQMGLDLVARALIRPGNVVAVEALGYRPAWEALRLAGARLLPLPVDRAGLRVEALDQLCRREAVRAVYVTPHHQYPTTVVLAPGRRLQLLELARARRLAIIEDDYDHEFHFEGRPVLPLASADRHGVVVYVGTLSKLLAPGLRIGFTVAPLPLIDRLAALRATVDRQGDQAVEWAVAELLEDGEVQRHARRARKSYRARRDALVEALRAQAGGALELEVPAGGMTLWARVADGVDVDAWAARALEKGVVIFPGRRFAFDGRPRQALRLGYASLNERELKEAVRRMVSAMPLRRG